MNKAVSVVLVVLALGVCRARAAAPAAPDDPRVTPIVLAYRKARPAVANISTTRLVRPLGGLFGDDLFEQLFRSPMVRDVPVQSLGSGFLISPEGYLITNAHVVRRALKITVTLSDKSRHTARIISADEDSDLAVLKIDPAKPRAFAYLPLGRSDDLMVGETVIAIGNPVGLAGSLTRGVISATGRDIEFRGGVRLRGLIQTDAPINPGNSGGPLLNVKGELIGINTAIRADAQNIGFAIPIGSLAGALPRLLDFQRIGRVTFGATVTQKRTKRGLEVLVRAVEPGTPAADTLRAGDRILALDGREVRQIADYVCGMMAHTSPGTVRLRCLRGDKELDLTVTVKAKPRPDGKALARKWFGLTLREITPQLARDLNLPLEQGLLVVGLDEGGPAARLGLRLKDVIFQLAQAYVVDLDALGVVLEDIRAGRRLTLGFVRGNVMARVRIRARQAETRPRPPQPKLKPKGKDL